MRTFKLTDDCTLSGRRLHRDARRVEGGGYVDPAGGPLVPAHGVVLVRVAGMKKGTHGMPLQIWQLFIPGRCRES